ncbi:MAG: glycosyltransferase family 1 protein [Methanosarcinales archaeon]|nr:MAG: glycosyltransferase family 1 protein [Methanosarcinales archaeon]
MNNEKDMKTTLRVGVFTGPIKRSGVVPVANLITILSSLSDSIYLVTGDVWRSPSENICGKVHLHTIKRNDRSGILSGVVNHIRIEFQILRKIMSLSRNVDLWICFMGDSLTLPILAARLAGKKVILVMASDYILPFEMQDDILRIPLKSLLRLNFIVSSRIVLYSERHIDEWHLGRYRGKVSIAHEHFLDVDKFKIRKKMDDRTDMIGYIGRFSVEKGILPFLDAIPQVFAKNNEISITISGDGDLLDDIEQFIDNNDPGKRIRLSGWIPHEKLPESLNELKLLVLPSHTEGLPNIMLEAMACGTPVLATHVGAIPDLVGDESTGFVLKNNSPEEIAEGVIRALEYNDIGGIIANARRLVEDTYTYRAAVEEYREILASVQ